MSANTSSLNAYRAKLIQLAAEWDESAHPRDDAGKFTGGGSGESRPARTFSSEEGYAWHETGPVAAWAQTLPKSDVDAFENYAGFGYSDINKQLRGQFTPRSVDHFVREATQEERESYKDVFTKTGPSDYEPDDPTNKVHDGRIVHNVFYRNDADEKVEWSIQRTGPDVESVKRLQATAEKMNESIRERGYVLPEKIQVFRGAYLPGVTEADLQAKVGGEIVEHGFTSTMLGDAGGRLDGYVAHGKFESLYKRFNTIRGHEDEPGVAMRVKIDIPAGTKIASLESVRRLEWSYERNAEGLRQYDKPVLDGHTYDDKKSRRESEVLLGSGARFKVKSVSHGGDYDSGDGSLKPVRMIDVHMEYVGGGSSAPTTSKK